MSPEVPDLRKLRKVIGIKQSMKAIEKGTVVRIFVAENADPRLTESLQRICREHEIAVVNVGTMEELGTACGIDVGAAAVAILE